MIVSTARPLLEILALRALLVSLPFAVWFVWRDVARRSGREMGSTPWAWLFTIGAVLMGLSLMATVVFHADNRGEVYIPGEPLDDGSVSSGRFEPRTPVKP